MANKEILPAVTSYINELTATAINAKSLGINASAQVTTAKLLSDLCDKAMKTLKKLKDSVHKAEGIGNIEDQAMSYRNDVLVAMDELRKLADEMEVNTAEKYWPIPTYGDLLFSVKE